MSTIKQITVTFDFDPKTETTSNLKCFIDGVEKKKTTTTKASKKDIVLEDEAIMTREDNKLVFNNKAVADMELEYQDRVVLKYEKMKGSKVPMPVVGKDISFDEEGSGNKVTKTNTVSCRGKANDVLKEYGSEFTLELLREGIWKLVSTDGSSPVDTYESIIDQADETAEELGIFTEDDSDTEILDMSFNL